MAEKKKKGKRAYLEHFKKDEEGRYVYKGDFYTYQADGKTLGRVLARLWGMTAVMIAACIGAGCVPAPGMDNCFYIIIPYVAGLMSVISVCWAVYRLSAGGHPLKAYIYDASIKALPARTILVLFCVCAALAGETVFVCIHGFDGKMAGFFILVILDIIIGALAIVMRRCVRTMKWVR